MRLLRDLTEARIKQELKRVKKSLKETKREQKNQMESKRKKWNSILQFEAQNGKKAISELEIIE